MPFLRRRQGDRKLRFHTLSIIQVLFLVITSLIFLSSTRCCHAKEIEATNEWTKLGENDTIAAGMHVRMDLTTGEKYVKLVDDESDKDTGVAVAAAVVDANGNVLDATDATTTTTTTEDDEPPNYDFDMMHRTLSNLPDDEKARMGGIPELPPPATTDSEEKAKRRQIAEARLQEIWERRQAELKEFEQDHLADLPKLLKDRIKSIKEYLEDPYAQLQQLNLEEASQVETPEYGDDGELADDAKGWISNDIVSVLADLEYHLGDVDMTRDFYTLGGWPLLTSLLADAVHQRSHNDTKTGSTSVPQLSEEDRNKVNLIQAHAAWAVGTAVKNTGEFMPYAVDEVVVLQYGNSRDVDQEESVQQAERVTTTPIDLVMAQFVASAKTFLETNGNIPNPSLTTKLHKTLYAMGALLRGNRVSQTHFCSDQGPAWVGSVLKQLAQMATNEKNGSSFRGDHIKLVQRLLALSNDVVMDVALHESSSPQVDSAIQHAFSSETWCSATIKFLDIPRLYEPTLQTIHSLAPHCREHWQIDAVQKAVTDSPSYSTWLPEDLDDDLRKERAELLQSTLDAMVPPQ